MATDAARTSTAVMARRVEPDASLDFFPTPPWATRAFLRHVLPIVEPAARDYWPSVVCDPACGEGHMIDVLKEQFAIAKGSDIFDYGKGWPSRDFLHPAARVSTDWIVTNPPFNSAEAFARKALRLARRGVALLVRTGFLESEERYRLFAHQRPTLIAHYAERVPMHRGRWAVNGKTATAYCWVVWAHKPVLDTLTVWIPPGRRQALSSPDDFARFGAVCDLPAAWFGEDDDDETAAPKRRALKPAPLPLFGS